MEKDFITPMGVFTLSRDSDEDKTLRAWDTSDNYALDTFKQEYASFCDNENLKIAVFNDSFGALTCSLSGYRLNTIVDSYSIRETIEKNLGLNTLDISGIDFASPLDKFAFVPDFVFLKVPKSQNYLEFLLQRISDEIPAGVPVIGLGMSRNIHTSTVKLFEHYLTGVSTSLARKKSRLLFGKTDGSADKLTNYPVEFTDSEYGFKLINNANLFSFGKIDKGTLYFLEHFPRFKNQPGKIIDLGCGDGILALYAAEKWSESEILCVDNSYLAVDSAAKNFENNGYAGRADFKVTDCLKGVEPESCDLILCNPPFHEYHSVSIGIAGKMFKDSFRVLKQGGSLFVVKNKHLGYQSYLKKLFGNCRTIAGNKKYEILKIIKE